MKRILLFLLPLILTMSLITQCKPAVKAQKTLPGVKREKIEALIHNVMSKPPSEYNTDWFGTMLLAGLLNWRDLGHPEVTDYVTKWFDYHLESRKNISDDDFRKQTSSVRTEFFREYTLLIGAYAGYFGASFTCDLLYKQTGNETARQVCKDVGDVILNKMPRNELGLVQHDDLNKGFTIPDVGYFVMPPLFIAARAYDKDVNEGNKNAKEIRDKLMAEGKNQLKKFTDLFLDKDKKIAKTIYRDGKLGETYWTRANGWLLWSIVESVEFIEKDSEFYNYACNALDMMAQGIAKYQDGSGAMHLLINEPDTPLETSGTIMTAYGIHKAVRMGWIDKKYSYIAVKAWNYADSKIDDEGNITGCYSGWAIPAEERDTTSFGPLKSVTGMLLTASAEFEKYK